MKNIIMLAALLLGACAADATAEPSNDEAVDTQALVAPRPGGCATILCLPTQHCVEHCDGTASCVPSIPGPKVECSRDADCRLFSDYCEGCNCVALGPGESEPKCTGNIVQCFVDPCLHLEARCEHGSCVAVEAGSATF